MKTSTSHLRRLALLALSLLCLGASAIAGPGAMFVMMNGQMMMVTPLKKDMKLKNGCTVCVNGAVTTPDGKTRKVKDGYMVSDEGKIMQPLGSHGHGG